MGTIRERCLFLLGVSVLLGLFFTPAEYGRRSAGDAGTGSWWVENRSTTGLAFSPWHEYLERREGRRTENGVTETGGGSSRIIWASWSWLLLLGAVVWFWIREDRLLSARRGNERRDQT